MPDRIPTLRRGNQETFSLALLVAMHVACLLVFFVPFTAGAVAVAVGGYLMRMWAITAGYHRYFAHRSFKTSRAFQCLLAVLGASAMQNGPLWWASWHRSHHRETDRPADPHSPLQRGLWHAHMGWILSAESDHPNIANVADLSKYPELRFIERHKWLPMIAYACGCFAIAGVPGLVWGGALSSVLVLHATALINSAGHTWGHQRYATRDESRNNFVLALITLGEGWHNNHHHAMHSARQGFRWWEIDLTYYSLRVLSLLGVIWGVREPSARTLKRSLLPAGPAPATATVTPAVTPAAARS